jgi:hypothetical protein
MSKTSRATESTRLSVRRQILPQELDLNYYRKFLGDLVTVMRDAKTKAEVESFKP